MENKPFEVSDTSLTAEWKREPVPGVKIYKCSNCGRSETIECSTWLGNYCDKCGAKMKNPQYVWIHYDYGV